MARLVVPHPWVVELVLRRRKLGLTQEGVAAAMGVSQTRVSDIENGRHDVRLSTLVRYAEACGCRLDLIVRPVKS